MPLNEGIPDQTYDTWRMKGESAYVGHLWLAALRATGEMGEELAAAGVATLDGLDVRATIARYDGLVRRGPARPSKSSGTSRPGITISTPIPTTS